MLKELRHAPHQTTETTTEITCFQDAACPDF
jgi:hypothetical protein